MRRLCVLAVFVLCSAVRAEEAKLPSWVPAQDRFAVRDSLVYEFYGEGTFQRGTPDTSGDDFQERGKHWSARLWPTVPPPWNDDAWNGKQVAGAIAKGLSSEGFTPDYQSEDGLRGSFHKGSGEGARYISFSCSKDDPHENNLEVVEVAPIGVELTLPPPGKTPEKVSDEEDFPFLERLPGWTLAGTSHSSGVLGVEDAAGNDLDIPGGVTEKGYRDHPFLSRIAFENIYERALTRAGWKLGKKNEAQGFLYAHWDQNGRNLWAYLSLGEHPRFQVAEVPALPSLTLAPPAPKPEVFGDTADFPYLKPLAGWRLVDTRHSDGPLDVRRTQDGDTELVGSGAIRKEYDAKGISNYVLEATYEAALTRAGWRIGHKNQDQGFLYAHYDQNGRDVWLYLRNGERVSFTVADVGSGLKAALAKQCKVAVYGVNFDFDKATLRPDAEPVLTQVLALFQSEPKLSAEIGGHTDNVGQPAYNQKLSGERADAVKAWLVKHGVSSSRLTTRGYGDKVPLVPNNSDENRAKNRRVELKKPDCR